MQIKGEEFIKKVQLQQEREELERKLSELEEVQVSISNSQYNNMNNTNTINNSVYEQREPQVEVNEHELDNIMLGSSSITNEDNKKKYLILGIVLVVLFLLTIIIIRLLTSDPKENDQFTSNANSSEIKKLSENNNIEENFQKIINERVKKDTNEPMVPESAVTAEERLQAMQQLNNSQQEERETIQEEAPANISNETVDQTIKKIEEKRTAQKVTEPVQKKEPVVKENVEKKTETKKSVKEIAETQSVISGGYFVQIGAFTKKPSDSYINTIRSEGFKYKVLQVEVKGTLYNKVLIGPYSSKAAALEDINDIKEKLKVTNTFIVKF